MATAARPPKSSASRTRRSTTRPRNTRLPAARTTKRKNSWEELAQREPYYAVLTDERYLLANLDQKEFFATGEADVADILQRRLGGEQAPAAFPQSALDFGCGVGRLTRALAKRIPHVVGVDISPTMLEYARRNVPEASFHENLPDETFDLIVSLIVLQHVEVERGMQLIGELLARLNKHGALVLQVPVKRAGGRLRRLARSLRARSPLVHRLAGMIRRERMRLPYMQMNAYELASIRGAIERAGCVANDVESASHADMVCVTLTVRKL